MESILIETVKNRKMNRYKYLAIRKSSC